jgi:hypothetical protein
LHPFEGRILASTTLAISGRVSGYGRLSNTHESLLQYPCMVTALRHTLL